MADLLGEVDVNIPSKPRVRAVKDESRRKARLLSPPLPSARPSYTSKKDGDQPHMLGTPPADFDAVDDAGFAPPADDDVLMSDPLPSSPVAKAVERKSQVAIKIE